MLCCVVFLSVHFRNTLLPSCLMVITLNYNSSNAYLHPTIKHIIYLAYSQVIYILSPISLAGFLSTIGKAGSYLLDRLKCSTKIMMHEVPITELLWEEDTVDLLSKTKDHMQF